MFITTIFRNEDNELVTEDSILSEDISMGGLRLVVPHKLAKGKIIDLKIFLFPDPIHLPAKGRVAWSSEKEKLEMASRDDVEESEKELYWVGIQFIDVDAFHRERVLHWIKKEFKVIEL